MPQQATAPKAPHRPRTVLDVLEECEGPYQLQVRATNSSWQYEGLYTYRDQAIARGRESPKRGWAAARLLCQQAVVWSWP